MIDSNNYVNINNLPADIIINHIIPNMSINRLKELCSSNSYFAGLCRDENIWRSRVYLEFPNAGIKPYDITWLEFYLDTKKWYEITINKFSEMEEKPDNLLWSQYYRRLLYGTAINKNIIIIGGNQAQLSKIKIIPTITTLKSLFIKIDNMLKDLNYESGVQLVILKPLPSTNILNTMTSAQLAHLSILVPSDIILFKLGSQYYSKQPYDQVVKAISDPNFGIILETVNKPTKASILTLLTILVSVFGLPRSLLLQITQAVGFGYTSYQSGITSYLGSYITRYLIKYLQSYELTEADINTSLV